MVRARYVENDFALWSLRIHWLVNPAPASSEQLVATGTDRFHGGKRAALPEHSVTIPVRWPHPEPAPASQPWFLPDWGVRGGSATTSTPGTASFQLLMGKSMDRTAAKSEALFSDDLPALHWNFGL